MEGNRAGAREGGRGRRVAKEDFLPLDLSPGSLALLPAFGLSTVRASETGEWGGERRRSRPRRKGGGR